MATPDSSDLVIPAVARMVLGAAKPLFVLKRPAIEATSKRELHLTSTASAPMTQAVVLAPGLARPEVNRR
jgi:hypothetical protein